CARPSRSRSTARAFAVLPGRHLMLELTTPMLHGSSIGYRAWQRYVSRSALEQPKRIGDGFDVRRGLVLWIVAGAQHPAQPIRTRDGIDEQSWSRIGAARGHRQA